MKKYLFMVIFAALFVMMSACGNNPETPEVEVISLTADEVELLEAIGTDLVVIDESSYAETVSEMIYHVGSYTGKVVQLEGLYDSDLNSNSIPYVYRVLNNNGTETICGIPLSYIEKEIPDNSWVRVSAIVSIGEINGTQATVLEVIAIETLAEGGQGTLNWNGSAHNH